MKKVILYATIITLQTTIAFAQTWSQVGTGLNGAVGVLFSDVSTEQIYVGGSFTEAGGITANFIAKWNGISWDSLGSGVNGKVQAISVFNGELYVGGNFTIAGGVQANYIAKWNGFNWDSLGQGLNDRVYALAVFNNELFCAGNFTTAGGITANYIAKWNGTTWSQVGTGTDDLVLCLKEYNEELYAGGFFENAGSLSANKIAKWNGTTWSPVGTGINGTSVWSLAVYDNDLYLGGSFLLVDTVTVNNITKWNGSSYSSLGIGVDDHVYCLMEYNCDLYVGGGFGYAGGISVGNSCIAKWNGSAWSTVGSDITALSIKSLSVYNESLFVGGSILSPGSNILKWNSPFTPVLPSADFYANDTNIHSNKYIKFYNTSTGASTYKWILPGGIPSTSTLTNPLIFYPDTGIFDVTLISTNCSGNDTLTKYNCIVVDTIIHTIPLGISSEYLTILTPPNSIIQAGPYEIYYYKPSGYNSINSPILCYIHGSGGSGAEGISLLQETADRRNALIVSPTMQIGTLGWAYVSNGYTDTITENSYALWSTQIFKQIYRNILERESRDNIPIYLTGFSQGGQFVTRYMLVRQFDPDSIPIVMSASVDPANYTLCTNTFNGNEMDWTSYRCGLAGESPPVSYSIWEYIPVDQLICNSHIKQYYNENYAVLIGTNDTVDFPGFCPNQGGDDRYERAIAFYNFSDTNAVNRGTTLQWQYAEIPDIGHDGYALYNTVAAGDSIPIAERVLFETPWHPVPDFSPVADFSYVDTGLTVHFTDLTENVGNFWYWDFGDGDTSVVQNPQHSFASSGTYYVCLTAGDSCITDIYCDSISVTSVGINSSDEISDLKIYPNPFSNTATIELTDDSRRIDIDFTVYDQIGREVKTYKLNKPKTIINSNDFKKGIYYYEAHNNYNYKIYRGKLLIID